VIRQWSEKTFYFEELNISFEMKDRKKFVSQDESSMMITSIDQLTQHLTAPNTTSDLQKIQLEDSRRSHNQRRREMQYREGKYLEEQPLA